MQVGSAEVCITPPIPIAMGGYGARVGRAEGIHDDLYVRCLVFESDGSGEHGDSQGSREAGGLRHVLLSYDLVAIPDSFVSEVKRRMEETCCVPAGNTVLHTTHTHSGPDLGRSYGSGKLDNLQVLYTNYLVELSVTVCLQALRNLEACEIALGERPVTGVGSVRRFGETATLPIQTTGWFRKKDGSLKAAIVSFPCHPTVMGADNRIISADYPGVVVKTVRKLCGAQAIIVPLTGAAGDVSTRFTRRDQTFEEVERLGTIVGAAAVRTLLEAKHESFHSLHTVQETLEIPVQPLPSGELLVHLRRVAEQALQAWDTSHGGLQPASPASKRIVETQLQGVEAAFSANRKFLETVQATISVWSFGNVVYAFWPGEPFHSYDTELKRIALGAVHSTDAGAVARSDSNAAFCVNRYATLVGYTDGTIGYIPDVTLAEDTSYEVLMSLVGDRGGRQLLERTAWLYDQLPQS